MHTNYEFLKKALEETLTPGELFRVRREAAFHPTPKEFEVGLIEEVRIKEMSEHREKVLAPLNTLFLELAKDLLKAGGSIGVPEDLEGVEVHFKNGKPCWGPIPPEKYEKQEETKSGDTTNFQS